MADCKVLDVADVLVLVLDAEVVADEEVVPDEVVVCASPVPPNSEARFTGAEITAGPSIVPPSRPSNSSAPGDCVEVAELAVEVMVATGITVVLAVVVPVFVVVVVLGSLVDEDVAGLALLVAGTTAFRPTAGIIWEPRTAFWEVAVGASTRSRRFLTSRTRPPVLVSDSASVWAPRSR